MDIKISALGINKRFVHHQIINDFSEVFEFGQTYVIKGSNGSGKSTLLKLLIGYLAPNSGNILYQVKDLELDINIWNQYYSFAAPYLGLIEEFTLQEYTEFHTSVMTNIDLSKLDFLLEKTGLSKHKNKWVKYFSSGMKQRLKLALAFSSNAPILFLDEPGSNLDQQGFDILENELNKVHGKKLIILASNDDNEHNFLKNVKRIHL